MVAHQLRALIRPGGTRRPASPVGSADVEKEPESPMPGSSFGGYKIERALGGSGAVREFRAVGDDGIAVRVRTVDAETAASPEHRARFEREARISKQIEHPNLVGVLETGVHDGIPFLVQPNVGELTLAELLSDRRRLEIEETVAVVTELGSALDALHEAGVVHRDVCPANVIIDSAGGAHLGGFALVKDTQGTALTEAGTALGSVDYMAPEQIRGEAIGPAADVYALACLCFESLGGRPPFGDRAGMRVLWAHLQDDPPPLAVGAEVDAAVERGLAKDPDRRPASASRFARMLELAHEMSGP